MGVGPLPQDSELEEGGPGQGKVLSVGAAGTLPDP